MNRNNIILFCFIILSTISLVVFPIENIKVSGNKIYLDNTFDYYNNIGMQSNQNLNQTDTINRINDGYTLFSPLASKTTYLIDDIGNVVHTWDGGYKPGLSAYLIENGSILRSGREGLPLLSGGGHIQKITWANEIVWDFTFIGDNYIQHHDFKPLPNGNILLIVKELKTNIEAVQAGRATGTLQRGYIESEFIVEVKPTGPTSGEIVWEWHVWDHLIQEYDSTKDNYGSVKDNPQLIDINHWRTDPRDYDWIHMNSIDYNQELDQILLTTRNFDEIWIIDHNTTKTEASGHTGGKYHMGGDLLYRWGNPLAYQAGTRVDQKLFSPHDATWIEEGYPGDNNILVYNNEDSSVDEIVPPVDDNGSYTKIPNQPYKPHNAIWRYRNPILWQWSSCGAQRLPNGNTLICCGLLGFFLEVAPDKEIVWQYTNPYDARSVYKIHRYYEIFSSSNPPELLKIYGPNKGINGVNYNFTISATDPENDDVFYMIDWGDGDNTGWIGEFKSGENITVHHIWEKTGTYVIKMKAKDIHDVESEWATLEVSMPKNKPYINTPLILQNLIQRFPLITRLLQPVFEKLLNLR